MNIFPSSRFLTLDVGESHAGFAAGIRSSPNADFWVLRDSRKSQPKWYVLPAVGFSEETIGLLDEEEHKKRLRQYMRNLLRNLPEAQTVAFKPGKVDWMQGIRPEKSGYQLALKRGTPICIAMPKDSAKLHPRQQKAEIDLAKLSDSLPGSFRGKPEGRSLPLRIRSEFMPEMRVTRSLTGLTDAKVEELVSSTGPTEPAPPSGQPPTGPEVAGAPPEHPREPAKVAFAEAFPWITPSSEHVVQRKAFDVEVALRLTAAPGVQGSVMLPKQEGKFTLDVHLLFEDQSAWDKLEFNWTEATTKPAKFPGLIAPKYHGSAEQPDFRTIRVNFYLNNRWCGEGLKNLEILSRAEAPLADEIPVPPEPEWRKYLNVVSTTVAPPDLLVRIQEIDKDKYQWSFLSPHRNYQNIPAAECQARLKDGAERYVKLNFEPLANLTLNDLTKERLEGTCKHIYDDTPKAFKDVYWDLYHAAEKDPRIKFETIQFVSDEPFVPWEIMQVADDLRAPGIDAEILSIRHAAGRWVASESSQLRSRISLQEMAIFASDYKTVPAVQKKLIWAEQEAQDLVSEYKNKPKAVRHGLLSPEVVEFLKQGKAQVVHFSCHGRMDQQTPSLSALLLEDDQANFVPAVVTTQASQHGIGSQHPLVFLNACQVGGAGAELTFVTGWPQAFLAMGASAVIAPLWSVGDKSARDIALQFYNLVIGASPISLGAALQNLRKQFKTNNQMTYLAYLLYGDPNTLISVD